MKTIPNMNEVYGNILMIYREALKQRTDNPDASFDLTRAKIYEATTYTTKLFEFAKEHEEEFNKMFQD